MFGDVLQAAAFYREIATNGLVSVLSYVIGAAWDEMIEARLSVLQLMPFAKPLALFSAN